MANKPALSLAPTILILSFSSAIQGIVGLLPACWAGMPRAMSLFISPLELSSFGWNFPLLFLLGGQLSLDLHSI